MRSKLNKLEMVRGFAAMYVFAGHFLLTRAFPKQTDLGFLFRFGQEAVMLFFLVSGFVIYYSTVKHGDQSFRPYIVRRARRIYPIFGIALLLSWASWAAANPGHLWGQPASQLLGNLCMLQDFSGGKPGVWVTPFCGNSPLWSLSYEWWFYMLFFPLYRFVPHHLQIHLVAFLSFLGFLTYYAFPNQLSLFLLYFITWWSGAELGYAYLHRSGFSLLKTYRYPVVYLGFFSFLLAAPVLMARLRHIPLSMGIHPVLELRHFSACFLFLIVGLTWSRLRWIGFQRIFGPFLFVAPISYGLYVFHYPLAVTSTYLAGIPSRFLQLFGYVVISFIAAFLAEIPFQNWINRKTKTLAANDEPKVGRVSITAASNAPP